VYLERYFEKPRHVEVQIPSRRHLTLSWERASADPAEASKSHRGGAAPAFMLPEPRPRILARLLDAGLTAARAVGYGNAGLRVLAVGRRGLLHRAQRATAGRASVTEATTGLDLVQLQLRIASGEKLPSARATSAPRGHAIECRINAETR